jgi:hypothetical protein
MLARKGMSVLAASAGLLSLVATCSNATRADDARGETKADGTVDQEAAPPSQLIFYDGFEYEVKRDERNEKPAFISQGKWSGVKSQNSRGKGLGYLYTVDRIPGYAGPLPGRDSKRVLAMGERLVSILALRELLR